MYTTLVKKIGLVFPVLTMVMIQTVKADMMFYYSAAILPSIIASNLAKDPCLDPIVYNDTTYSCVTSPYTAKVWLDRNLGAAQVCTALDDALCYGDYYQWGRNFDEHEDSTSETTDILAVDVGIVGHGDFITVDIDPLDWADGGVDDNGTIRAANWSKLDGSSVCPVGFRVPTVDELKAELFDAGSAEISNSNDAFESFLKFPSAGYRGDGSADMISVDLSGWVWASSVNDTNSSAFAWVPEGANHPLPSAGYSYGSRAYGFSVRCLMD